QKLKNSEPLSSELAGYIFSEVNRVNALVARFLDFARPSNLELRRVQIAVILDRALEAVQTQMPEAQVRVERHYAAVPDIQVDDQLCDRIFVNLIQNAFQATDSSNGIAKRVLHLRVAPESSGVQISIEDTG